ncbi:hypothetical protein ACHAWF_004018 [Thalassiosira exigua]
MSKTKTIIVSCLGVSGLLRAGVEAWSPSGPPPPPQPSIERSRRGFLATAGAAAASATVCAPLVSNAAVASSSPKIYEPPPGSLEDQVHVVTGATSGLGLESAKRLAAAGATTVLTARDEAKGRKALEEVRAHLQTKEVANEDLHVVPLDLCDLSTVRAFPDEYERAVGSRKVDVLMNNAGAKNDRRRELTKGGFERTFQSNHLGHFLLTSLMFPRLNRDGARVINVSLVAHTFARDMKTGKPGLDLDNLNGELSYLADGREAYGNTKLENILFAEELQRRVSAARLTWLEAVALHPGMVGTDIWRETYVARGKRSSLSLRGLASTMFYNNLLSTEEGSNTHVMLASEKSVAGGEYYDKSGKVKELAPFVRDEVKAKALWVVSERMVGCTFDLK